MSEITTPTGRVHWLGTGMSTGSGLGLVCAGAPSTLVWGRTVDKAEGCLNRLGLTGRAQARALTPGALAAELRPGDLVVSMLPASHHAEVLRQALDKGAHFACSSYVSPEMAELGTTAEQAGLVVLTEAGLDPGIDHLLGHELVRRAGTVTSDEPATAHFTSYCGSNPAVANDFRYRFSWAPRGVLTALLTPARFISEGRERVATRPWEAVEELTIDGELFEAYPNRDSVPFVETYHFPASWRLSTFVRGTLRLDGWSNAWTPVFSELLEGDENSITALAEDLAGRYPTTASDHDRVVMSVGLQVACDNGARWRGEFVLNAVGDESERATPRLVSVALACGILDLVEGRMMPGLHQAAGDPEGWQRWLDRLARHGITAQFRGDAAA
jgi:saccharopine dehydrogenase-like protein